MDLLFITVKVLNLLVTRQKTRHSHQIRQLTTAGTDAGHFQAHEGIPAAVLSVPCRYIHSPASIINLDDYKNTLRLAKAFRGYCRRRVVFEETAEKFMRLTVLRAEKTGSEM